MVGKIDLFQHPSLAICVSGKFQKKRRGPADTPTLTLLCGLSWNPTINLCQGMVLKTHLISWTPQFWRAFLFKGSGFGLICQEISQDLPKVYGLDQVGDLFECFFNMHFFCLTLVLPKDVSLDSKTSAVIKHIYTK